VYLTPIPSPPEHGSEEMIEDQKMDERGGQRTETHTSQREILKKLSHGHRITRKLQQAGQVQIYDLLRRDMMTIDGMRITTGRKVRNPSMH
jgi:hypothetical protein